MTSDVLGPAFWLVIKLFAILGLIIYTIFTGVVLRQEQLMAKVLEAGPERVLRMIAWLYLGISLFILLLAVVLL